MWRLLFILFIVLSSCSERQTLLGDCEARCSSNDYSEFVVYDSYLQIYSNVAGLISSWDYKIVGDSLHTPILNYKMDWIKKDSIILRNEKFTNQLRRINGGACISEVEGNPQDYQLFIESFYDRRNDK